MIGRSNHQTKNLTNRQRLVLDLILAGRTNPQIADELGISLDGAKWHVSEALDKLGASNREEAASLWRSLRTGERRRSLAFVGVTLGGAAGVAAAVVVGIAVVLAIRGDSSSRADALVAKEALDFTCPVTVPSETFVPPDPYLPEPPASYDSEWYGTGALWILLPPGGERWGGLPKTGVSFSQKTFWWSANYQGEDEPQIAVTGRRLDGPGEFTAGNPGTNATADFGRAMLVGVDIPTNGCWELRGEYKGAELSYVVRVE